MTKSRDSAILCYTQPIVNISEPTKAHWMRVLSENIAANFPELDYVPIIRVKSIRHTNRLGYAFKQNVNRVRITIIPDEGEKSVEVLVYDMPSPTIGAVGKPKYGIVPIATRAFSYEKELQQLKDFCLEHLSKETPYSRNDYVQIEVTHNRLNVTDSVFYASVIQNSEYLDSNEWRIYCKDGELFRMSTSDIIGNRPLAGYYFIYKNDKAAAVVTDSDFDRYYRYID